MAWSLKAFLLVVVLMTSLASLVTSLPPAFHSSMPMAPEQEARGPPSLPHKTPLVEMCQNLCTSATKYLCPIGCQMRGFYSKKRNFGGFFDFNSKERDGASSFDDKMFMELLGRKYDDME